MTGQSNAKHGGTKKYGRNKLKCAAYRAARTREHNKIRRINQSSGNFAAQKWAQDNAPDLMEYARRVCK